MSIAKCYSAHLIGLTSQIVTVEVDISNGLHALSIVGLGDRAVEEAKDRVCAAIKNSGYTSPKQKNQKVVISLAPADVHKEGPSFDLAIALSYLCATGDIEFDAEKTVFIGELSLEGNIRKVSGVLPILCELRKRGFLYAFIPQENAEEASLAEGITAYGVCTLKETLSFIREEALPTPIVPSPDYISCTDSISISDMKWVRGNDAAKRGLEIAAAGGHNVLMFGPPGTGKTMMAQGFTTILPPLSHEEAVEVTSIHSAARALGHGLISHPPFRAPHHTASFPAVVGGGAIPRPGEITLAHRGVLFLDELPEFDRSVLEALREPLESRSITISRARGAMTFPAHCILIASMNPCPCGKPSGDGCECSTATVKRYRRRISGPILDRFDLCVNVNKVDYEKLSERASPAEPSSIIRARVAAARKNQQERFRVLGIPKRLNSEMGPEDMDSCIYLDADSSETLANAAKRLRLSGRAFHRTLKVARTIADIENEVTISRGHILEALQYRQKID
jgi:magnesium chelatase family protein